MAKGIIKNSRSHLLLKELAIGAGVVIISLINPVGTARALPKFLQWYYRKKCFEKDKLLRDLRVLQLREMIDYKELADGKMEIKILRKGKERVLRFDVDEIQIKKKKWDGRWRMVSFDVPEECRVARDAFRRALYQMGFYFLQKSVSIIPFPCEDEIDFIASFYGIRDHVLIFYVERFEGEEKLKYHFGI